MIRSIASLRAHLQTAIELEHSTIPPYLTALYSINDGSNRDAARVIKSVVMEEMLHMVLAANVLNAIGGAPAINHPRFVPRYPTHMPHSRRAFLIGLEKFSPRSVGTFLKIERPVKPKAPPQDDRYDTIGQFYAAIEDGLKRLCLKGRGFARRPRRQITPEAYYGSGGEVVVVTDLESALQALSAIVGQGEGIHHSILDGDHRVHGTAGYAHYFRFKEIVEGRYYSVTDGVRSKPSGRPLHVDWEQVHNMRPNPTSRMYPKGSGLRRKSDEFNTAYTRLLDRLHEACNGRPKSLTPAIALMYDLKHMAAELMRMPIGSGRQMAGPTFEFIKTREPQ
jgi:hypothetical protein